MLGTIGPFQRRLLDWYSANRRLLPWRNIEGKLPPPYHVLVSEFMLQQTQVKTVLPYFARFIGKFPDIWALADSEEQEVLRLWQGLGYYSRARNLRRAAQQIRDRFGGTVPASVEELRSLPGVGQYTAGAIASIAHGIPAPIVDGNVARVICRLDLIRKDPKDRKVLDILWRRAKEMVPAVRAGDFNSAMMELGATVCTPRNPDCEGCPVKTHCAAAKAGVQGEIPVVRKARPLPVVMRVVVCVEKKGKWLIEQRPASGRWASLWQFTTFPSLPDTGMDGDRLKKIGIVRHALTHRRYVFTAYRSALTADVSDVNRRWVGAKELNKYPMSKPQLEIARMLNAR